MAKSFLPEHFEAETTSDLTKRIREISDLRLLVRTSTGTTKLAASRAAVPMIYSHWEGHVLFVAKRYLSYVAQRRLTFNELTRNFIINDLADLFKRMSTGGLGEADRIEFVARIQDIGVRRFGRVAIDAVSARSNLNSSVMRNICVSLGFDRDLFAADEDFIDRILLERRNSIAHGEFALPIDAEDVEEMSTRVIGLMRAFRNEADNSVQLKRYLAK